MDEEYQNAQIFIMPSLRETTGTVLLEAFSNGLPVITIDRFGGSNLVDEETGWLYDASSKDEFINGLKQIILECIEDQETVKRKSVNAVKKAELFTWSKKLHLYNQIYTELLLHK